MGKPDQPLALCSKENRWISDARGVDVQGKTEIVEYFETPASGRWMSRKKLLATKELHLLTARLSRIHPAALAHLSSTTHSALPIH
jgi:hypothetical protein